MKKQLSLAALLSAFTLPALAGEFYVHGDVGQGKMEVDAGNDYSLNKTSTTYSVGAGYNFNEFFAVEVAYRDMGNIKVGGEYFDGEDDYIYTSKISATALQASVMGKLPISDKFSLFGRVGAANIDMDFKENESDTNGNSIFSDSSSESKTRAVFGLGASYKITSKIALHAEYSQFAKWGDVKLSGLTVGAAYKF